MHDIEVVAVAVGLLVGVRQAPRDARRDEDGKVDRDGAPQDPVAIDELLDVNAIHELHHHEVLTPGQSEMVGLDDIRVDQIGDEARLADEVLLELWYARIFFANDLNSYELMEVARTELERLVDDAHAALGDLPEQLVAELVVN